jgi:hypothetical protein
VREVAALADARRRARAIRAKTLELAEERGIAAGWLAVGLATWQAPDAARAPAAPVLLRSCELRPRGAAGEDFEVDLGAETELNPVLVHYLATRHDVHLDADLLADLATGDEGFDPAPVLAAVARACADVPGFAVERRLVVGTFSYARLPMVTDLRAQSAAEGGALAEHDVVAALAGDPGALAAVVAPAGDPQPAGDPDPATEHLVLDADSSQAAAIDAVLQRLASVGLDDLVLDLHDGGAGRRRIARELATTLDRAGRVPRPDADELTATLVDRRDRLAAHTRALHEVRAPWGVTAYAAQCALAELTGRRPAPRSRVRVRGAELEGLDRAELGRLREELREAASLGALRAGPDDDPWFGARLTDAAQAEQALAAVTELSQRALPVARERMSALLTEVGMPAARSVADWGRTLALVGAARRSLDVFSPAVFDTSLTDLVAATATAAWREEHGVPMGWWQRRRLRAQARSLLRPGTPPSDLHAALAAAAEQREAWQQAAGPGSRPSVPSGLDETERAYLDVAEPPSRCATGCGPPASSRCWPTWRRAASGPTRSAPSSTWCGGPRCSSTWRCATRRTARTTAACCARWRWSSPTPTAGTSPGEPSGCAGPPPAGWSTRSTGTPSRPPCCARRRPAAAGTGRCASWCAAARTCWRRPSRAGR